MAVGISGIFGIRITNNFAYPFFSTNISEFWKKWHISLTSWMIDYVFTPLNFILRDIRKAGLLISIVSTFVIVGLWHGANWTYISFGLLHGLYFVPLVLYNKLNVKQNPGTVSLPSLKDLLLMLLTFVMIMIAGILFKSADLNAAIHYFLGLFSQSILAAPQIKVKSVIVFIVLLLAVEWVGRSKSFPLENLQLRWKPFYRWIIYSFFMALILIEGAFRQTNFIYFQF
jgi:alginate O-acetyltransferase complex protein AlgI